MRTGRRAQPHRGVIARTRRSAQRGFNLISVMVSMVVASLGLLSLGGTYARLITATTQNQNLSQLAAMGNAYWGIVQANPAVVGSMGGTYTRTNVASAPVALQGWLASVTGALPGAEVVVAPGPDTATGASCSTAGCSSVLTIRWLQNANVTSGTTGSMVRSQTFNYQFGL